MAHKRFQPVGCVGGHGVRQCCRSCAISTPYNIAGREQAFDHDVKKQVRKSGGRQIVVDEVGDNAKALLKGWGFRFPRSFRWRKEETVQICGVGLGDGKEPGSGAGTQDRGPRATTVAGVAYLPGLSTGPCPSSPGGTCQEFRRQSIFLKRYSTITITKARPPTPFTLPPMRIPWKSSQTNCRDKTLTEQLLCASSQLINLTLAARHSSAMIRAYHESGDADSHIHMLVPSKEPLGVPR